jgi:hypothetical protein
MFIDPKHAARLLETNPDHQRSISQANLHKIEQSLRADKFFLNGQTVIVSDKPRLLDGQHRCQAAVNTGIGFWSVFVSNVPEEYFRYMDCGKARTFADVLKTTGHVNQQILASATARLAEYLKGPALVGTNQTFSHSELIDVIELSPGLDDSVRAVGPCKHILPASQTAWLHYILKQECPEQTEEFFCQLASGEMLPKTSPIFTLRARIINDRANGFHPTLRETCALLVKAWNAYAQGKPLSALRWQVAEKFPTLIVPSKKALQLAEQVAS